MPIFAAVNRRFTIVHASRLPCADRAYCGATNIAPLTLDAWLCRHDEQYTGITHARPACRRCQATIERQLHPTLADTDYWLVANWNDDPYNQNRWAYLIRTGAESLRAVRFNPYTGDPAGISYAAPLEDFRSVIYAPAMLTGDLAVRDAIGLYARNELGHFPRACTTCWHG